MRRNNGVEVRTNPDGRRTVVIDQYWRRDEIREITDGTLAQLIERHDRAMLDAISTSSQWFMLKREQSDGGNSGTFFTRSTYEEYIAHPDAKLDRIPDADPTKPVDAAFSICNKPNCGCREKNAKGQPKAIHVQFEREKEVRVDYSQEDLSAMQPVGATGNDASKGEKDADGNIIGAFHWPADGAINSRFGLPKETGNIIRGSSVEEVIDTMRRGCERIIEATMKSEERREIIIGEARRTIASRFRAWPRCPTHDVPLDILRVKADYEGLPSQIVLRCSAVDHEEGRRLVDFTPSDRALRALQSEGGALDA